MREEEGNSQDRTSRRQFPENLSQTHSGYRDDRVSFPFSRDRRVRGLSIKVHSRRWKSKNALDARNSDISTGRTVP